MALWWVVLLFLVGCADKNKGSGAASGQGEAHGPVFEMGSFGSYTDRPFAAIGNLAARDTVAFFANGTCSGEPSRRLQAREAGSLLVALSLNFHRQRDYHYSVLVSGAGGSRSGCLSEKFVFDTTTVVAGTSHSCAVLNNGLLKCWGYGGDGRTGLGRTDAVGDGASEDGADLDVLYPGVATDGGGEMEVKTVAVGGRHSCALMTDHTLRCWGEGGSGQLGNGDTIDIGDDAMELQNIEAAQVSDDPLPVQAVALGDEHSCALMGTLGNIVVKCWGKNSAGQLGLGDRNNRGNSVRTVGDDLPEVELGGNGATPWRISAGGEHNCVVFTNGGIKCWGKNDEGQLGLGDDENRGDQPDRMGDALPYVSLGENGDVRDVSAGGAHTCALLKDGRIKCWGRNDEGQLGSGNLVNRGAGKGEMGDSLVVVNLGESARAVSAGAAHTCALLANGSLKCWGKNNKGQLGVGDRDDRNLPVDVEVGDELTVKSVSAGGEHTCALLSDDSMKCWGEGSTGQLLSGSPDERLKPSANGIDLDDHLVAKDISMGTEHACALLNHGLIKCWGKNDVGQLGQGDLDSVGKSSGDPDDELDEIPPVNLGTDVTARAVTVGTRHSCAIVNDGSVVCWGANDRGQLGLGTSTNNPDPHQGDDHGEMGDALEGITFGSRMMAVQIGAGEDFTCALVSNASVRCWGKNDVGQLGRGDTDTIGDGETAGEGMEPVTFPTGVVPQRLSVGTRHACIVGRSGTDDKVYCWGDDAAGQLGQGTSVAMGDDEEVSGLAAVDFGSDDTVKAVAAGHEHTCALLTNDELVCWGANASGQLGRNSLVADEDAPGGTGVDIAHATNTISRMSLGSAHTCVVASASGRLECWGDNGFGQLGQGNTTDLGDDTTDVTGGTPLNLGRVLQLELGGNQGCAINLARQVWCWGEGTEGQLGRGDTINWGDDASETPPWTQVLDFGSAALGER